MDVDRGTHQIGLAWSAKVVDAWNAEVVDELSGC